MEIVISSLTHTHEHFFFLLSSLKNSSDMRIQCVEFWIVSFYNKWWINHLEMFMYNAQQEQLNQTIFKRFLYVNLFSCCTSLLDFKLWHFTINRREIFLTVANTYTHTLYFSYLIDTHLKEHVSVLDFSKDEKYESNNEHRHSAFR